VPNIHPLLVHFPIALIVAVVAVDLIALVSKKDIYLRTGNILTAFALAGAIAALISGIWAEESVWHTEAAEELIETHELLGFIFVGVVGVLAIIRFAVNRKLPGSLAWVNLIISLVATGIVSYSAYLGGEMVYRHGTGVAAAQAQSGNIDSDEGVSEVDELDEEEEAEESEESE
jgi:uncharacterized membrane protein